MITVHVKKKNIWTQKMKWAVIVIFGLSLAEPSLAWTYYYSNKPMNWVDARQWCVNRSGDMVVIQNQRENDHVVSLLPNKTKSPYYWIGITKNHKNETWTWIGNNSTWVGNHSWAKGEPNNNHSTEFCVEIYVHKRPNRGKWNDEKCANEKFVVCSKAQCNASSCERGRCQESIGNTTCLCEPGFLGDRCQTAVECPPPSVPDNGRLSCSEGSQRFNTSCRFTCDPGFLIKGSSVVTCGVTGDWSGPRPFCASYKHALLAVLGCGAISALGCFCFCWMKHRKRKKLAQLRQLDEAKSPSSEAHG